MKVKICVNHLHDGNDPNMVRRKQALDRAFNYEARKGRPYVTVARAIDPDTKEDILWDIAICCPNDQPNRRRGYDIAVGRLKKTLNSMHMEY